MAEHKIKITGSADFSAIERSVDELQSSIQGMAKSGKVELFDKETVAFLQGAAKTSIDNVTKAIAKTKEETKKLDQLMSSGTKTQKEQATILRQRLAHVQQLSRLERQLTDLKKVDKAMANGPEELLQPKKLPGKEKDFGERHPMLAKTGRSLADVGSRLPVVGQAVGVARAAHASAAAAPAAEGAAGASMPMMLGFGALGAAAGVAAIAISRMSAGAELFRSTLDTVLQIEATGQKVRGKDLAAGGRLGFGPQETIQTQQELTRAFGTPTSSKEMSNRLQNTQLMARDLGIGTSEITGAAGQLRATEGSGKAEKDMSSILSKAVQSGMDKAKASFFLSSAVGLLTDMNKSGLMNNDRMLSALADMTAKNQGSPEQAAKTLAGISNSIAGSQGESNAFFQTAAARAGLGGGTLYGTKSVVAQGLSTLDMGAMGNMMSGMENGGKEYMDVLQGAGLGDKDTPQKFAGGIMGMLNSQFNKKTPEGAMGQMSTVGQLFGTTQAGEQAKIIAVLDKLANSKALSGEEKKLMDRFGQTPEQNWQNQVLDQLKGSTAGQTKIVEAMQKVQSFELGKESMGLFNTLNGLLTQLDKTIGDLLHWLQGFSVDSLYQAGDSKVDTALNAGKALFHTATAGLFEDKESDKDSSPTSKIGAPMAVKMMEWTGVLPPAKEAKPGEKKPDIGAEKVKRETLAPGMLPEPTRNLEPKTETAPETLRREMIKPERPDATNKELVKSVQAPETVPALKDMEKSERPTQSQGLVPVAAPSITKPAADPVLAPKKQDAGPTDPSMLLKDMVQEQRQTNKILESQRRQAPMVAPRAGRN